MKEYFIKVFFAILTIGFIFGIGYIFKLDWLLEENNPKRILIILPIALVAGWGGEYLYKRVKNKKG
ncbi:hypothetical protein SAMN05444673_4023 [Bacillus sp. OV166]|uniref:hypothetical protein n=1 Tax=Bacillus sp. OV166 TaxID=1882763 RepID=UPI000A2AB599|nr:hypothetical protein [Bacillus sp. OV166]SMQ80888.1 hypothetical protein SAMN05444673_4023 [Bacillus sp. OV166]